MPRSAASDRAEHQAALLLLRSRGDLDREMMGRRWPMDGQRHLRSPVCAPALGGVRAGTFWAGAAGCRRKQPRRSAAASRAQLAEVAQLDRGQALAARRDPRLAAAAPAEARQDAPLRTVSMWTNMSSPPTSSGRLTKP